MTVHRLRMLVGLAVALSWHAGDVRAQTVDPGRKEYEARCAGCHGADGEGGGHGPGFVGVRQPRARSRSELRDLIRSGIPDAGMPGFALSDTELDAIAAYAEALRAPAADRPIAGDAAAGETFFKTVKGRCLMCHMIRGAGGIFGPDLSNLARERRIAQIEKALRAPADSGTPSSVASRRVTIRLRNGRRTEGIAKYESAFDLGVQTIDGRFMSI